MSHRNIDDGEFWLPPEFLTDEDFLVEKEEKCFGMSKKGVGFIDGSNNKGLLFPYEFPSMFGSPVESVNGSTETESDEEDYIAGLTRQMAHSTLQDDISFSTNKATKGWGLSGSPQSTLCPMGIGCGCKQQQQRSSQNCRSTWDLYCAAAEEVARMRMAEESCGYNNYNNRGGLLAPPRKPSPVTLDAKNPNLGHGYYSNNKPSLSYHKLQAAQFQQLKQQQMMKQQRQQQQLVGQNNNSGGRVSNNNNGRLLGLSPSAWPPLHQQQPQQQQQRTGSSMRAVFLGNQTGKRECAGTGVFLPRRVNSTTASTPTESRKKPALSTVLLPARVVQALKLNLDDPAAAHPSVQPRFEYNSGFNLDNENNALRFYNGNGHSNEKRGIRAEPAVHELRLPQEWSY